MKIDFTGTLEEIERQADEWVRTHPGAKVIFREAPVRVGRRDGEDIFNKADWTLTIEYEDGNK